MIRDIQNAYLKNREYFLFNEKLYKRYWDFYDGRTPIPEKIRRRFPTIGNDDGLSEYILRCHTSLFFMKIRNRYKRYCNYRTFRWYYKLRKMFGFGTKNRS